jgi:DNA-binding MarR family transcriptional regulator
MSDPVPPAQVLRQFRVVFNAVKSHFQQMEKQVGIGGAQVWALSMVAQQPGLGVSALGEAMDIHQSTASNLVKALVHKGLLRTAKATQDRRAVCLHITEAGQSLLQQAPGPWSGVLPDALAQLDPTTLSRLNQDLASLIRLLGQDDNEAAAQTPLAHL